LSSNFLIFKHKKRPQKRPARGFDAILESEQLESPGLTPNCVSATSVPVRFNSREELAMRYPSIVVRAEWDQETGVWVASSTDIDGLALEADSMEVLLSKIPGALLDLLELNGDVLDNGLPEIPYHVMAQQIGRIQNPFR